MASDCGIRGWHQSVTSEGDVRGKGRKEKEGTKRENARVFMYMREIVHQEKISKVNTGGIISFARRGVQ